jgi:hypothetical protein
MTPTKNLKIVLLTTAIVSELSALLFYFDGHLSIINELSNGQNVLFASGFFLLALLFSIAALLKHPTRLFLQVLCVLNALAGVYFIELLLSQNWSGLAIEILIADSVFYLASGFFLFKQMRKLTVTKAEAFAS